LGWLLRASPGTSAIPEGLLAHAPKILALAHKADQLFIEAVFLERDRSLALAAHHLTAWEAGGIAREAGVRLMTPFHHSARYLSEPDALREEAFARFRVRERERVDA